MGDYADDAIQAGLDSPWGWRRPRYPRPERPKKCRHCGEHPLYWMEVDGVWRLGIGGEMHTCKPPTPFDFEDLTK